MKRAQMVYLPISAMIAVLVLLMLTLFPGMLSLNPAGKASAETPKATKGILDLRGWDFSNSGPVPLNGEWEFNWQQLLEPGETGSTPATESRFTQVPGTWNSISIDGTSLPATGYATYRLTILLDQIPQEPAVRTLSEGTAFRLFIGEDLVVSAGVVGTEPGISVPAYKPDIVSIDLDETASSVDIVLQVSNFDYRIGGPWRAIMFGDRKTLERWRWQAEIRSIMLFGSLMMIAFYHAALFLMRPKDRYFLLLALFCLFLSVRALFPTEYTIVKLVPHIPFSLLVRLEYLTYFLAIPAATLLYQALYPDEFYFPIALVVLAGTDCFR